RQLFSTHMRERVAHFLDQFVPQCRNKLLPEWLMATHEASPKTSEGINHDPGHSRSVGSRLPVDPKGEHRSLEGAACRQQISLPSPLVIEKRLVGVKSCIKTDSVNNLCAHKSLS